MESNTIVLTIFAIIFGLTTACFITNCPPGGKRSQPMSENAKKQCTRCGPSGVGHCFGPEICCGQAIGCHFKNRFTAVCNTEDYSPHPCHNDGKSCANGKGVCALDSMCCTSDGCFIDKHCESLIHFKSSPEYNGDNKWSNSIESGLL